MVSVHSNNPRTKTLPWRLLFHSCCPCPLFSGPSTSLYLELNNLIQWVGTSIDIVGHTQGTKEDNPHSVEPMVGHGYWIPPVGLITWSKSPMSTKFSGYKPRSYNQAHHLSPVYQLKRHVCERKKQRKVYLMCPYQEDEQRNRRSSDHPPPSPSFGF